MYHPDLVGDDVIYFRDFCGVDIEVCASSEKGAGNPSNDLKFTQLNQCDQLCPAACQLLEMIRKYIFGNYRMGFVFLWSRVVIVNRF